MKVLLVGHHQDSLLSSLEVILKNWGYRVMASTHEEQLCSLLRETSPHLLLLESTFLDPPSSPLREAVTEKVLSSQLPLFLIDTNQAPSASPLPHERISLPVDLFNLFELIQKHMEKIPRKHLRVEVKLPGMICPKEKSCYLGEVLSLSTGGMFIKTGCRMEKDTTLQVIIPLMGMQTELEIEGKVIYRADPTAENNYRQGAGIVFSNLDPKTSRTLEDYLEACLFSRLKTDSGETETGNDQIRWSRRDITIQLPTPR